MNSQSVECGAPMNPPVQFQTGGEQVFRDACPADEWSASYWPMTCRHYSSFSSSRQGEFENFYFDLSLFKPPSDSTPYNVEHLEDHLEAEERANTVNEETAIENVFEIRRLTGFNWKKLAEIFNVDRRTLHNWVKGCEIRPNNKRHIAKTLAVIRFAERGSAKENAAALSEPHATGETPFDAIKANAYSNARRYLSYGRGRPNLPSPGEMSWHGDFQPMLMHEGASGSEVIFSLPDEPKPKSRKRRIIRRQKSND